MANHESLTNTSNRSKELQKAVQNAVLDICKETPNITPRAAAALAELVQVYSSTVLSQDLEAFSSHANRKRITEADVLLVSRKLPTIHASIVEKLQDVQTYKSDLNWKRPSKKKAPPPPPPKKPAQRAAALDSDETQSESENEWQDDTTNNNDSKPSKARPVVMEVDSSSSSEDDLAAKPRAVRRIDPTMANLFDDDDSDNDSLSMDVVAAKTTSKTKKSTKRMGQHKEAPRFRLSPASPPPPKKQDVTMDVPMSDDSLPSDDDEENEF